MTLRNRIKNKKVIALKNSFNTIILNNFLIIGNVLQHLDVTLNIVS